MRYLKLFLVVAVVCIFLSSTYADIPKVINFQGRLTDASGKFVLDGNYTLVFWIYTDSTGGGPKWFEEQSVSVSKGLFNVILGSSNPIPDSIFNYPNAWLGIAVPPDPEMSPRQRLSSLGYSYRSNKADTSSYSMNSDKLDGFHATDFASVGTDYGRSGVATDLYEGTSTLTGKYVNTVGPDSVYSTTSSAFLGKTSVSSTSSIYGVKGYAENTSSGNAYGGLFETSVSGTGAHAGVFGYGASNSSPATYGHYGLAYNASSGSAYGGYFSTSSNGTGTHYGIRADAYGESGLPTYGAYGLAENTSSGDVYGGFFSTSDSGTGYHYGVSAQAFGKTSTATVGSSGYGANLSSGSAYGIIGSANGVSSGNAYGGFFSTSSNGTGRHYGIRADGYGASGVPTYGTYGYGYNSQNGDVYGGYFSTDSSGTGWHVGVAGEAYGSSAGPTFGSRCLGKNTSAGTTYGVMGIAENTSTGDATGGYFTTSTQGKGRHCGVQALGYGSQDSTVFGVYGYASNSKAKAVGGYFGTSALGLGNHYGVFAEAYSGSSNYNCGSYSYAENTASGYAIGGYFEARGYGTGYNFGVEAVGFSNSTAYGVYAVGNTASTSNLDASYGGYFYSSSDYDTVPSYGVWAESPYPGLAGAFWGDVGIINDLFVYGTKSAVVKVDNGEYLAVYCQESPENWFEDFGEGQLNNGSVHIELDPLFIKTVTIDNRHPMKVFITLTSGEPMNFVVNKGNTGFDLVVSDKTSNATFDYRVVAKRKGYEDIRLTKLDKSRINRLAQEQAKNQREREMKRARMEQERPEMDRE